MNEDISWHDKFAAIARVARYRPGLTAGVIGFSVAAALLEGIGLSFIIPIVEIGQVDDPATEASGILAGFVFAYDSVGIPLTLGYLIVGVSIIMTIRFTASFLVAWMKASLMTHYEKKLRIEGFDKALDAEIEYFDVEGSDDILNSIITESRYSGRVIRYMVELVEKSILVVMYLAIAFYLSPLLTIFTAIVLGMVTFLTRNVLEPGYTVGGRVADANQRVQESVQAGTQGIRDVKLFNLSSELFAKFLRSIRQYADSSITLARNEAAINSFYNLSAAITVFVLIYLAFVYTTLTLGELGLFLFAMFQLAPLLSTLNSRAYRIEGMLSHLVRTHEFIDNLDSKQETAVEGETAPAPLDTIEFEDVWFSYAQEDDPVIRGISFAIDRGEFVGFVGQSGAGKSTIVSVLARLYSVDSGNIRANGVSIDEYDVRSWRERLAVVRQNPFIFNDTLRFNLTIGNRSVSEREIDQVVRIARIDEFIDDLPDGYETLLGDDGVRLSGGQRQRVALARALLKGADFLILDEATSDLDSNLEKEVQQSIERMDREYGILAIAHRLSTVKNADRIYTVEGGKITEVGDHHTLIENDGKYAELYGIQTRVG